MLGAARGWMMVVVKKGKGKKMRGKTKSAEKVKVTNALTMQ